MGGKGSEREGGDGKEGERKDGGGKGRWDGNAGKKVNQIRIRIRSRNPGETDCGRDPDQHITNTNPTYRSERRERVSEREKEKEKVNNSG